MDKLFIGSYRVEKKLKMNGTSLVISYSRAFINVECIS